MLQEVESGTNFSASTLLDVKAEIDLLYPIVVSDYVNHAAASLFPHNGQDGERDNARQSNLAFMHRYKYLVYASAPNDDGNPLVDPSGLNEAIALPVTDGPDEVGEYDLSSVSWLTPGMFYWVRNVMWAIEIEKDDFIYG
jgi:hypothetical protein